MLRLWFGILLGLAIALPGGIVAEYRSWRERRRQRSHGQRIARIEVLLDLLPTTQWLADEDDARALKNQMFERHERDARPKE